MDEVPRAKILRFDSGIEFRLQRILNNKKLLQKTDNQTIPEQYSMANYFFIFGPGPRVTNPSNPSLLCMYPSIPYQLTNNDISHISQFCYPSGFQQIATRYNSKRVLLQEFAFYFNSARIRSYGICVHVRASSQNLPFYAVNSSRSYPFCLCLLSNAPFISSHFQFLTYVALSLSGRVAPIQRTPISHPNACGTCLSSLVFDPSCSNLAVSKHMKAPSFLGNDLDFYFYLPVEERIVQPPPIRLSTNISLSLPLHLTKQQQLAYPTLSILFSHLSVPNIVKVYSALLLESHVLFVSNSLHVLSMSVIAATTLLDPFHSPTTVLPSLPSYGPFLCILQTPTPYLVGLDITHPSDVIVDLDNNEIRASVNIPPIPKEADLTKKLAMLLLDVQKKITTPPRMLFPFFGNPKSNPEFENFMNTFEPYIFPSIYQSLSEPKYVFPNWVSDQILLLFSYQLAPMIEERVRECYVTDTTDFLNPVTIYNKELFLLRTPDDEQMFYQQFVYTVLFDDFCGRLTDDFEVKKSVSVRISEPPKGSISMTRSRSSFTISHYVEELHQ